MTQIISLINKAGGTIELAYRCRVTTSAIDRWKYRGIPDEHILLVAELAKVSPEVVIMADRKVRRKRQRQRKLQEANGQA